MSIMKLKQTRGPGTRSAYNPSDRTAWQLNLLMNVVISSIPAVSACTVAPDLGRHGRTSCSKSVAASAALRGLPTFSECDRYPICRVSLSPCGEYASERAVMHPRLRVLLR